MSFLPSLCSPHVWKEHCDSVSLLEVGMTWNSLDPENLSFCSTPCDLAVPTCWLTFEGEKCKTAATARWRETVMEILPFMVWSACLHPKRCQRRLSVARKIIQGHCQQTWCLAQTLRKAESADSVPKAVLQQTSHPCHRQGHLLSATLLWVPQSEVRRGSYHWGQHSLPWCK